MVLDIVQPVEQCQLWRSLAAQRMLLNRGLVGEVVLVRGPMGYRKSRSLSISVIE